MNKATQKPYRKRHLFARSVEEVVKSATKPLMGKQGKLYGALLADWGKIVGELRARVTRPERIQFPSTEASGAILHLSVRTSMALEISYQQEQILEQCARYFGYRAIERIVLHATTEGFDHADDAMGSTRVAVDKPASQSVALPETIPGDMRSVLERLSQHIARDSDKKN